MKPFLKLSSLLILVLCNACSSPYRKLVPQNKAGQSSLIYKPVVEKTLYRCIVNGNVIFNRFHLSGLLLFKKLENGTVRAVFQNEMGLTFFDFEWDSNDSFKVNQVIPQLNKPAVIKTLKKDVNLLLMKGVDKKTENLYTTHRGNARYYCFVLEKGYAYYIEEDKKLVRIENAGRRQRVITINMEGKETPTAMPAKVFFNHHKARFTIALQKLESHVDE